VEVISRRTRINVARKANTAAKVETAIKSWK